MTVAVAAVAATGKVAEEAAAVVRVAAVAAETVDSVQAAEAGLATEESGPGRAPGHRSPAPVSRTRRHRRSTRWRWLEGLRLEETVFAYGLTVGSCLRVFCRPWPGDSKLLCWLAGSPAGYPRSVTRRPRRYHARALTVHPPTRCNCSRMLWPDVTAVICITPPRCLASPGYHAGRPARLRVVRCGFVVLQRQRVRAVDRSLPGGRILGRCRSSRWLPGRKTKVAHFSRVVLSAFKRNVHRVAAVLLLAGLGVVHAQTMAPGYPDDFMELDAREVRLLPPYCMYSQYFSWKYRPDEAEKKRWEAALGPTFIHIHHYCFALLKTNRALFLTKTKQFREFYLRDSLNEFNYVIQRAPDDFVLLPEILTKKGENLVRLGRGSFAVFEFERAIELNPKFWPPYAHLADYYKSTGDTEKAKEILGRGLSEAPDTKPLLERLAALDRPAQRQQ